MLKSYKELKVWQKSYGLCLSIYKLTKNFPQDEKYGMVSQMKFQNSIGDIERMLKALIKSLENKHLAP